MYIHTYIHNIVDDGSITPLFYFLPPTWIAVCFQALVD